MSRSIFRAKRRATPRLPRGYPEASPEHLQSLRIAAQARLEPWHSIEKSGEPSDAAWRSGGFDGTSRQGQGKTLDFPAVWRLPPPKTHLSPKNRCHAPAFAGALTKRHSIADKRHYGEATARLLGGPREGLVQGTCCALGRGTSVRARRLRTADERPLAGPARLEGCGMLE